MYAKELVDWANYIMNHEGPWLFEFDPFEDLEPFRSFDQKNNLEAHVLARSKAGATAKQDV